MTDPERLTPERKADIKKVLEADGWAFEARALLAELDAVRAELARVIAAGDELADKGELFLAVAFDGCNCREAHEVNLCDRCVAHRNFCEALTRWVVRGRKT